MDFLSLVGSSGFTCTDSPNRFVSQYDLRKIFSRQGEYRSQLSGNYFILLVSFAFFQHFTDTEDRSQAVSQSQFNFFFQDGNCFAIVSTTFWVTQDYIFSTCRSNHSSWNFTSVSTWFFISTVFSTYTNLSGVYQRSNRCQMDKRSTDDYITVRLFVSQYFIQFFCKSNTLLKGFVHFPVSCNNVFSHFVFYLLKGLMYF